MNRLKKTRFFSLGRKWVFTLALFLLVFAAASIVKVQAASVITGWLWGGSEDKTMSGTFDEDCSGITDPNVICGDGNETGLGWISMNRSDCDPDFDGVTEGGIINNPAYPNCPDGMEITKDINYGVQMPSSGSGAITGYAWSSNVGWIQFDPDLTDMPTSGCLPGPNCVDYSSRITGNHLSGWARFKNIADAGVNAGGWSGWIKLDGKAQDNSWYGVDYNSGTNEFSGYAWSNELGAIDFSGAKTEKVCTLKFYPEAGMTLNENTPNNTSATLEESEAGCDCGSVALSSSKPGILKLNTSSPVNFSSLDKINLDISTLEVAADDFASISASSTCPVENSLDVNIENRITADCVPSEQTVSPDSSVTLRTSPLTTGVTWSADDPNGYLDTKTDNGDGTYTVHVRGDVSMKSVSVSAGTGNKCVLNIGRRGWIETN